MEAALEKLLKAYKAKAKAWRRQVGQYRRAKQKQTKAEGKKPAPVKIAEGVEPDRKAAREWLRVKGGLRPARVTIAGHELDVIDVNCPIPPEAVRNQFLSARAADSPRGGRSAAFCEEHADLRQDLRGQDHHLRGGADGPVVRSAASRASTDRVHEETFGPERADIARAKYGVRRPRGQIDVRGSHRPNGGESQDGFGRTSRARRANGRGITHAAVLV